MVLERIKHAKIADLTLKNTPFAQLVKENLNINRQYASSLLKWKIIATKYPYLLLSSLSMRQIHNHFPLICQIASDLENSDEKKNDNNEMETEDEIY